MKRNRNTQKTARCRQTPLQYKFGGAFFCELPFYVNRHVLIPRFDTEKLVEAVILNAGRDKAGVRVLDMCTGSGCIAVVLAKHDFDVTAVDISRRALRVAKRNARLHDVNIKIIQSDLFSNIVGKFDVLVSNPPYIKTAEIGKYDASTLCEPRIALDGGADGLDFYRRIARGAGAFLPFGGKIFLEIDAKAAKEVETILRECGFCDIKIIKDSQGLASVIYGIFRTT